MVISSESPQLKNNKGISKPSTTEISNSNMILEHILGSRKSSVDLYYKKTYVDKDEPWSRILTATAFEIHLT